MDLWGKIRREQTARPNRRHRGFAMPKRHTDRAWAAGFIDGEGYISVHVRQKHKCLTVEVSVGNTNHQSITHLQELFGGHIQHFNGRKKEWSENWRWTAPANVARIVLKSTIPYMQVKRKQAELALELLNHKNYFWTPERYEKELALLREIRLLNCRVYWGIGRQAKLKSA